MGTPSIERERYGNVWLPNLLGDLGNDCARIFWDPSRVVAEALVYRNSFLGELSNYGYRSLGNLLI